MKTWAKRGYKTGEVSAETSAVQCRPPQFGSRGFTIVFPLIAVAMLQDDHGGNVGGTTARLGHGHTSADTKAELVAAGNGGHPDQLRYGARRLVRQSSCGGSAAASPLGEFYFAAADADSGTECAGPPSPTRGVGARMRAGLRASNRRARHLPMRYETGLPSSVIRFRTLHASTASRRCPDELRARKQSPTIDLYRKNAFSTRAC